MSAFVCKGRMYGRLTTGGVAEDVAGDVQVLPNDEGLHGTKLEGLECVVDTETVLASVLADLVEVLLDELLLLNELDVRESLGRKLNSLSQDINTSVHDCKPRRQVRTWLKPFSPP